MRHDDQAAAVGEDLLECGERTADTGVVGDVAVLIEGHIEVYTYYSLLAIEIKIFKFSHCNFLYLGLCFLFLGPIFAKLIKRFLFCAILSNFVRKSGCFPEY